MSDPGRRLRELTFLERVARASATASDHTALLRSIVDETTEATDTQVCSLYLWDDAERVLTLTATNGLAESGIGRVKLGLGEGVTGWVAAQRRPLVVPDVRAEPRFVWVPNLDQERFSSMLSVPILSRDHVVGVMNVQTVDHHEFAPEEVEFLSAVAAQIAGIVELSTLNARLSRDLGVEHEAVRRLEAVNAGKQDLLAMLSHDFRNPLAVARGYLHGLSQRLNGADRDASDEVGRELASLERMVDGLLMALRAETEGALALDRMLFDLAQLVGEQADRTMRASPGHPVRLEGAATLPVVADREKVSAVVVNLLGNAVKYSPDGGAIEIALEDYNGHVEVRVRDHGAGIDEREVSSLFERFGRGRASGRVAGHGLGLYICKRIVEAHGGTVFARRLPDGSIFGFTLPVGPAPIGPAPASAHASR
ncbi:MAG TPA: ATP-binding protein [Candidatus Limnocylindria bacterium]